MARVPYLTQDDLPQEYQHLFETDPDDPADVILPVHRALANNPGLFSAWGEWVTTIYEAIPDARLRELIILAVADVRECQFIWHQHVRLARELGIDDREIRPIHDGELGGFTPAERAAVTYAVVHATHSVTDEIHARLSHHFEDSDIIAISFLASEYERASSIIEALDVEIDGAFVGWQLEDTPT